MQALIRLRVFLLCCLLMIGMNVMFVMSGLVTAGSAADDTDRVPGCDRQAFPKQTLACRSSSRNLAVGRGYGFCVEKR